MLPTDSEIARARADLEAMMLPDTCNILSGTNVIDAMGGGSVTWGTAKTHVACRLDDLTGRYMGREELVAGGINSFNTYVLTIPHSTTITVDSRVEHGDYTYEVKSVSYDRSWSWCKRAMVERI
jgi:hypothetical protein